MEDRIEAIEAAAMELSRPDRARLAERLIASLDEDAEVEQAWADEVRRRMMELRSGGVKTVPGENVFDGLKDLFREP